MTTAIEGAAAGEDGFAVGDGAPAANVAMSVVSVRSRIVFMRAGVACRHCSAHSPAHPYSNNHGRQLRAVRYFSAADDDTAHPSQHNGRDKLFRP
jgi:hypothetical protein